MSSSPTFLAHDYFCFLLQSLRARSEKSLVKSQKEDSDSSRYAIKQVLSFTLTEQVKLNEIGNYLTSNSSDNEPIVNSLSRVPS
jgi:hypothetical protein